MKKKLFVLALSLSMMSSLLVGQALAGTVDITGSLSSLDAPEANLGVGQPCTLFSVGITFNYQLRAFKVTADGTYAIGPNQPFIGSNGWAWTDLAVYDGPFIPGDPLTHCMVGTGPATVNVSLVKDHIYYLIIFTYDFGTPGNNGFGRYDVSISGPGNVILVPNADDRINWDSSQAGPVALYCHGDKGDNLEAWIIDQGSGKGTFLFTWDNFSDPAPATNTLLFDAGTVQLWRLTTGEYEVHAVYSPQYGVWKGYAFIFNGCPYDGAGYTNNFDPGEGQ